MKQRFIFTAALFLAQGALAAGMMDFDRGEELLDIRGQIHAPPAPPVKAAPVPRQKWSGLAEEARLIDDTTRRLAHSAWRYHFPRNRRFIENLSALADSASRFHRSVRDAKGRADLNARRAFFSLLSAYRDAERGPFPPQSENIRRRLNQIGMLIRQTGRYFNGS